MAANRRPSLLKANPTVAFRRKAGRQRRAAKPRRGAGGPFPPHGRRGIDGANPPSHIPFGFCLSRCLCSAPVRRGGAEGRSL